MRTDALPPELSEFNVKVSFIQKRGVNEWSSSCPSCGGDQHQNHEWPDRMRWFKLGSDGSLKPRGWCRKCGAICWPNQRQPAHMSKDELAQRREMYAKAEKMRLAEEQKRRERFAAFSTSELWIELNHRLTLEHKTWWDANGVPSDWLDFWKIGYTPDKMYLHNGAYLHSPAYTIPVFDLGFKIKNLQYRLLHPAIGAGRYRSEYKLDPTPFISRPDLPLEGDEIVIVEGAKKCMTLSILMGGIQMIAVPSMNDWAGAEKRVSKFRKQYVMLDPESMARPERCSEDWEPWPAKMCRAIGPTARLIEVSQKPDDMITHYGATAETFKSLMKYASPVH